MAAAAFQKASSAAVFWGCGDLLTQALESRLKQKHEPFDYKRAVVTGAYGCFFVTPIASMWYGQRLDGGVQMLKRLVPQSRAFLQRWAEPQNQTKMSMLQSGLTFTFLAPILATSYVTWTGTFYKGSDSKTIVKDWKAQFLPIMASDFFFWPIADWINFRFAPPSLRFYVMLVEDMLWSAILSVWGNHLEDLKHFNRASKEVGTGLSLIQEAVMSATPRNLYTLAALRMLDVKQNGVIDVSEFNEFIGSTNAHIDFEEISGGKDVINLDMLTKYLEKYPRSTLALLVQFRMMDLNGNGVVSRQEMRAVVGEHRTDALFDQVDANHDGVVSFDEFLAHESKVSPTDPIPRIPSRTFGAARPAAMACDAE